MILPTRHKSRRPAGYAFVTFKDEADANKAVETLNETGAFLNEHAFRVATEVPCLVDVIPCAMSIGHTFR